MESREDRPGDGPVSVVRWTGQLGARVRALREARGLSVRALARRSQLSPDTVSTLESDPDLNPFLGTLLKVQRGLGLSSIEQLLGPFETFPSAGLSLETEESVTDAAAS